MSRPSTTMASGLTMISSTKMALSLSASQTTRIPSFQSHAKNWTVCRKSSWWDLMTREMQRITRPNTNMWAKFKLQPLTQVFSLEPLKPPVLLQWNQPQRNKKRKTKQMTVGSDGRLTGGELKINLLCMSVRLLLLTSPSVSISGPRIGYNFPRSQARRLTLVIEKWCTLIVVIAKVARRHEQIPAGLFLVVVINLHVNPRVSCSGLRVVAKRLPIVLRQTDIILRHVIIIHHQLGAVCASDNICCIVWYFTIG